MKRITTILFLLLFAFVLQGQTILTYGGKILTYDGKVVTNNWFAVFPADPIPYSDNPLKENFNPFIDIIGSLRAVIKPLDTYHSFEELNEDLGVGAKWNIRKRTSSDGISFSARSAPLFAPGGVGEDDEGGQADPTVIYDGVGDWKMWMDEAGSSWRLAYSISVDGITWTEPLTVIDVGDPGEWDDENIHHPVCIKHNGVYYLFYSGSTLGNPSTVVGHIGLATSNNGINWVREPTNPVISYGAGGEWDDEYIRPACPRLIYGTWYMWYWGFDGTDHCMGLATSPDLINWTKQGKVLSGADSHTGITASNTILTQGDNPRDIIVETWYTTYDDNHFRYANIALPYTGTKIDVFTNVAGNLWNVVSSNEPETVSFNNINGNKKSATVDVDSEFDYAWVDGYLYVYSEEHPDIRYQITYNKLISNFSSGVVQDATPTTVSATFDYALDDTSVPATSAFTITGKTVTNVAILGTTLTLTVNSAFSLADVILLGYTKPATNSLKANTERAETASFTNKSISNNVVLSDAYTWAYYDFTEESIITKAATLVSQVNDKSGNGHHLLQAGVDNKKPTWDADGLLGDGTSQYMKTAADALNQPTFIYLVMKQITHTNNDRILDGNASNLGALYQNPTSPQIAQYAGAVADANANLVLDTWSVVRCLFNGAASRLQIDATAVTISDAGAGNMGGFTLMSNSLGNDCSNIQVAGLIIRTKDDALGADEASIYNGLLVKYTSILP